MAPAPRVAAPPGVVSPEPHERRRATRPRSQGPCRGWLAPEAVGQGLDGLRGAEEALEAAFAARPEVWMRRMPGRETFAWPDPQGTTVLKRYLGDEPGEALAALIRLRSPRSPGRREGENLRALAADGLPVPAALGWWEERNPGAWLDHRFGRSAVLMQRVAHEETLRDVCRSRPDEARERWTAPLAELVARLHARGWYHRDLYLQHVVLASSDGGGAPRLVLLDVGRARRRRRPRRRWFVKDLAALLHSAPESVGPRPRLRFFAAYCARRGVAGRAARRALLRDVAAKARRMAARPPRHVDPADGLRGARP